jgi:two-component system, NtrC family, sensor kinase
MQRRGESEQPGKAQRTTRPKSRKGPVAPVSVDPSEQFDRVKRERDEALEQQAATLEVLRVIRRSPSDAQPVFDMIAESAAKLCAAQFCFVYQFDGQLLHFVAHHSVAPELLEINRRAYPKPPSRGSVAARAILEQNVVQVPDATADPDYELGTLAAVAGYRSAIGIPILRDGIPVGSIAIARPETGLFPERQIELLKTFAEQAVIAIENVRLFNELRESLQQQTATADVLKVISSSPGELSPVFNAMLENATRICAAEFGTLYLRETDSFRAVAIHNAPPAYVQARMGQQVRPPPDSALGQVAATRQVAQIDDVTKIKSYVEGNPYAVSAAKLGGYRTIAAVPMLKDHELVGAILIYRQEVRPFTEKQIALLQNFAAQAVIAIENTRLLNELRESLQQQTATAEVLKTISGSTGQLEPVFNAMLENAVRICGAKFGSLVLFEGNAYRRAALHNAPAPFVEARARDPVVPLAASPILSRVAGTKQVTQFADIAAEHPEEPIVTLGGARTILSAPMLNDDRVVGVISIYRQEVRPFTDKQTELVKNFAAQAVIAIENTRLLNELRQRTDDLSESLEQQTATSEVLGVISSSPTDVQPVFDTIANNAVNLCGATYCITYSFDGEMIRMLAHHNLDRAALAALNQIWPMRPDSRSVVGQTILGRDVLHVEDVASEPNYIFATAHRTALGIRTYLGVPMMREGQPIGAIALYRRDVKPFSNRQIELVKAFADQAVIAIENVRLFERVEARTRELAKSLEDLRTTQDRLVQTQKLALLGQLTAGIAHEIKNPLNFVNNFSGVSGEMIDELREVLEDVSLTEKKRNEITELMDTLRGNFDKVVQHGKRADAIVKNMLQHSREGSGEHRPVDVNALVEESLNLAWHGARAEKQSFEIALKQSFDPSAGEVDVFPQDIRRALLNVISNGFHAATKRKAETDGGDYEPILTASTKNLGDRVEIRIRDNGTGIAPDVKEKMFNPFFTTKPTGEGTGLGLSISHDIIVKQHAGAIEVDTQPGEFTEITVILPRAAMFV